MRIRTITARAAAATRADVIGGPAARSLARTRAHVQDLIVAPHIVTVRIGPAPTRDLKHMDVLDFKRMVASGARYYRRAPICRSCLQPIGHGEKAILFSWGLSSSTALIHFESCESA